MILLGLRSRPCDDGNGQRLSPQPSVRRDRQIDGVIGISAFSAVLPSSRPPFLPSFYLAAPSIRASVSSDVWQVGSVNGPSSFLIHGRRRILENVLSAKHARHRIRDHRVLGRGRAAFGLSFIRHTRYRNGVLLHLSPRKPAIYFLPRRAFSVPHVNSLLLKRADQNCSRLPALLARRERPGEEET